MAANPFQYHANAFYVHHGVAKAYEIRLMGHMNILADRLYPTLFNQHLAPQFRVPMANAILGRMAALFNELERHRAEQHARTPRAMEINWRAWRDHPSGLHADTLVILHNIRIVGPNIERFPYHTYRNL